MSHVRSTGETEGGFERKGRDRGTKGEGQKKKKKRGGKRETDSLKETEKRLLIRLKGDN